MQEEINNKALYVSTSIAYVNGAPHVGFAMESIEADVIARWGRYKNRETFFVTGTDEHGEKIQRTAEAKHTTPQKLCDENSAKFRQLGECLNISNDYFIRTSDQEKHWPSVHKLWNKLIEAGDLEKKSYTANYCYGCEAFMLEKDLDEDGNCPNHKRPPEEISEENYFFNLSKYSEKIVELLETNQLQIVPEFRKNEILTMAKEGFHDISFSRPSKKLPWGVSVPNDDSQNMYVWCDALTNYISALDYVKSEEKDENSENKFNKFWGDNSEVVHVIGKDILRFHAGIWIGMLLSAQEKLPNKIFVHGFLTSEGHKMSKSIGNVVDPFGEVEKYGTDALRYFLLREVPIGKDADFSRSRFEEIYQAHLANGLGNLVSRVYNLCERSKVFSPSTPENLCPSVAKFLAEQDEKIEKAMTGYVFNIALEEIFKAVDFCDQKINTVKPWELIATNPEKTQKFLTHILYVMLWISEKLTAFLPDTAKKIEKIFNNSLSGEPKNNSFGELKMLFPRLEKLNLPNIDSKNNSTVPSKIVKEKKINFTISETCQKLGIYTENMQLSAIAVKKTPRGMQKFLKQEVKIWLEKGGANNPQWKERIEAQDAIKTELGFDSKNFICAPLMLADLAEKNGKLPNINNIVDLYNIISLKHGLSAGAHDINFLDKNVCIDITKGENIELFTPMPGKEYLSTENTPIQKNEYAFFINEAKTKIGCRFDAAQCEESKITEGNKNIFIYFQSVNTSEKTKQWAKDAMIEFVELVKKYGLID